MSGSAFWPLQMAVRQRLLADPILTAKITGVFDSVPNDQAFPYVTIGDVTSVPNRTFDRFGEECTITLHIWSRYNGFKEAAEILDDMNRIMADTVFSVSGWDMTACYYDFSETLRDPDGLTRHIPVRYRVLLQKQ
ncbi:Uncharacterised protein [Mycobacterium tuberculosis]|nr:Uncharacterised protein [Mycobacterium tuberculosis]